MALDWITDWEENSYKGHPGANWLNAIVTCMRIPDNVGALMLEVLHVMTLEQNISVPKRYDLKYCSSR